MTLGEIMDFKIIHDQNVVYDQLLRKGIVKPYSKYSREASLDEIINC
jgi:hypothetical protein